MSRRNIRHNEAGAPDNMLFWVNLRFTVRMAFPSSLKGRIRVIVVGAVIFLALLKSHQP